MKEDAITTEAQVAYELNKLRIQRERLLLKLDQAELVRARIAMKREPCLYKLALGVVAGAYGLALVAIVCDYLGIVSPLSAEHWHIHVAATALLVVTPTVILAMLMRAV